MIKEWAGVSGIHTILLLFVCLPAKHQPTRQTPALQRKHTTRKQANHPSTHLTPTHPTDANLPAKRQPYRHPLAFLPNASPPVKRQRYSASTRPEGK